MSFGCISLRHAMLPIDNTTPVTISLDLNQILCHELPIIKLAYLEHHVPI